ncbi:MAG: acetamidase/formamidase family protein [Candidatus Bathyarchaeia archaeon]|nr:acetamidase/formamidase family protein [Candidatus Bathyarchaeota archaeon]
MEIGDGHIIYAFTSRAREHYRIRSGDTVVVHTPDCFGGLIRSEDQDWRDIDFERVNGAVGPIYVEGAEPGGVLKVEVVDVEVEGDRGVMAIIPGFGLLKEDLKDLSKLKICRIRNGYIEFNGLTLEATPMIGTIGVAPRGVEVPSVTPMDHGGNLDTKDVKAGNTIYFPVFVKGALLALGDCHAVMGDGEVCVTGVEVPARVTLRIHAMNNLSLKRPLIETGNEWMTIGNGKNLEEAARQATLDMMDIVQRKLGFSRGDAYMLLSAVGDLRISQVVDPLVTVRMALSKKYLKEAL